MVFTGKAERIGVTARGVPSRGVRAALAVLLACVSLSLPACANSHAGIPSAAQAADPALRALAERARAGDKHAQLELGIAFEEGRRVPRDLKRAKKLYRLAARESGGIVHIYSPPVGRKGSGRVIAHNLGPRRPGLAEAKARLDRLR